MSLRSVALCYTDCLDDLLAELNSKGQKLHDMFVSTPQFTDDQESLLMIKDYPHRLDRVLNPLIGKLLMQTFGAKVEGHVYLSNPRQPWDGIREAEREIIERLTGQEISMLGGFTWPNL